MGEFSVVARVDKLSEYLSISEKYQVGFEINDFYDPMILDDEEKQEWIIQQYKKAGIPSGSTMHGAFFDVVVFSSDPKIAEISKLRMRQSMDVARRLGVSAVIFHTNGNPMLFGETYDNNVIDKTVEYMAELLRRYPDLKIYLENMFDADPKILKSISQRLERFANYGVCLDYAHASISGFPMEQWVLALEPYLKHIHISDNDLKNDLHMPLGHGYIDWNEFIELYKTYFAQCTVLIETTRPEYQIQSLDYLHENFLSIFED